MDLSLDQIHQQHMNLDDILVLGHSGRELGYSMQGALWTLLMTPSPGQPSATQVTGVTVYLLCDLWQALPSLELVSLF